MLTGALSVQTVDNGWRIAWQEGSTLHQEVFVESRAVIGRIAELIRADEPTLETSGAGYDPSYKGPVDAPSPADGD